MSSSIFKPRDYQEEAIQAIIDDFDKPGNSVVIAATGAGKSIIIAEVARRLFQQNSFAKNSNNGNINICQ